MAGLAAKWRLFGMIGFASHLCQSQQFQLVQTIAAPSYPEGSAAFTIDGVQHLAVTDWDLPSKIYKVNSASGLFEELQSISTQQARDWEAFEIDGVQYLVVANFQSGATTYNINSVVYRWGGSSFVKLQDIPTSEAFDWEAFVIDGVQYLVVANFRSVTTREIDSKVYKWDGSLFVEFQSIPTSGGTAWAAFSLNGVPHLAVANGQKDDGSFDVDSKVYSWDGNSFMELQSIPTSGALGWAAFVVDGVQHLAVANSYQSGSTNTDSVVYKYDGTSFVEAQRIPTKGAFHLEAFSMDGVEYLAVANSFDDVSQSHNIDSKIYKWEDGVFVELQAIRTNGGIHWEAFSVGGMQHLAVANYMGNEYSIYLLVTTTTTTSATWTATSTTTTRTEPLGKLAAIEFAFADVGVLSLATLAACLLVLAVPVIMMNLLHKNRKPAPMASQQDQAQPSQMGNQQEQSPQTYGQRSGDFDDRTKLQGDEGQGSAPGLIARVSDGLKRNPYALAIAVLLESGNLISTLLYAMEAYQRATLISYSVPCGSGILMPMKSFTCPIEKDIFDLPLCSHDLEVKTECEADVQVVNPQCQVESQLNNCGKYDLYTMEQPGCAAIGCAGLSNFLWVAALMSFFATVSWTAMFFYRPHLPKRFAALFVCLFVLMVAAFVTGATGGTSSTLAMAVLCSLLPICNWSLAAWIASQEPKTAEDDIASKAAGLEIPFFSVLLALQLNSDTAFKVNEFRDSLAIGLRIVEDAPELILGILDLVYFGGSWYAWFSIGMSMAMVIVKLMMGLFSTCLGYAKNLGRQWNPVSGRRTSYVIRETE